MFKLGDRVIKVRGYPFTGTIVAVFLTLQGYTRYVIECTERGVSGRLRVVQAEQLEIEP